MTVHGRPHLSKTDSKPPDQENARLSKMNQLPIIYQERFTFDPLFDPYFVPLIERSIFDPKFSKLSLEKYFEYFRIFISRIFLKFEIEQ